MAGGSHDLVLGRYRLGSPLGQGGFGQIYTGLQVSLHREIAIKTIKPNMVNADLIRERFRREALLAASINHPNVVTIHDFGVDCDGDLVLVMELLKGANLFQELRLRPKPTLEQVARRVRQAANGLGAAHCIGIIHRDIKPSNIFLIHPGKDTEFVKIIDF
ncbi:MAG TPA: serine/threonine-protein kinase, partial [Myxococcota bacterium]|nr:serine/threonine-protein kinase [Myxococcota bacterium]